MRGVTKTILKARNDKEVNIEIRTYRNCTIIGKRREKSPGFHIVETGQDAWTLHEVIKIIKGHLGIETKMRIKPISSQELMDGLFGEVPRTTVVIIKKG